MNGIFFILFFGIVLDKLFIMKLSTASLIFFSLLLELNTGYASDTLSSQYPRVLLVQLRSEHNRIEALTKARRFDEVEAVKNDAQAVIEHMKMDFHEHFDYCAVYYYIDTNAEKIKKKQFEGILLHEDGSIVKNPSVNSSSNDYAIAYYGFPISQSKLNNVQKDTSLYTYDPQSPLCRGLVIVNDQFLQLTYFYKFGYDDILFGRKRSKKYVYKSKHFDIEYYPFAGLFNNTMLDKYGRRRLTEIP